MNYRKDFPMLEKDIVYFDNGATTFKPNCVIDKMYDYYKNYSSNAHRGDYSLSLKASDEYEIVRDKVKELINASRREEIIFTSGSTESLNEIVNGYFKYNLKPGDEVLLTKAEHASNILPWFELENEMGIKVNYIPLTSNHEVTIENVIKSITDKTKVISIAHISNVIGDVRPIKEIINYAHKKGILVVVDGAQSVPHIKTDVQDLDIDFLAFSAHKMCGPTGVGVLYGKYDLLKKMIPFEYGGGMNLIYDSNSLRLAELPYRFEAGTPNLSGIIGFSEAINYLNEIGMDNIERHEKYLKKYLIKELEKIPYIKIYNKDTEGSIVLINIDGVLSGDLGLYLNTKGICVRSGKHCAKMGDNTEDTVRISLYFYNTYEEIDYLIKVLKNKKEIFEFAN